MQTLCQWPKVYLGGSSCCEKQEGYDHSGLLDQKGYNNGLFFPALTESSVLGHSL